ncbi:hypothetical protein TBLA_0D00620 [Henningerozyma blattae CBS 6284]|uniref:ubiquitinyl hydrolase 1 n=1 Tax=Henningerozyma blattae (strain ATCC 34711 / CBS 6284 / DSM 70876 / NBRC 10599 / NRRL Y-10934 / UCD 77-7) TaxID=1071380 RepID=I2H2G7_HENB6|nr:hypothetical protein TBLA_0D00620 [Tetrapisispora blattae CBS 6284]CCH60569.1 hypothetical protein TBLA_0D00620 [Tetrapisispora blattae CBS 6284]
MIKRWLTISGSSKKKNKEENASSNYNKPSYNSTTSTNTITTTSTNNGNSNETTSRGRPYLSIDSQKFKKSNSLNQSMESIHSYSEKPMNTSTIEEKARLHEQMLHQYNSNHAMKNNSQQLNRNNVNAQNNLPTQVSIESPRLSPFDSSLNDHFNKRYSHSIGNNINNSNMNNSIDITDNSYLNVNDDTAIDKSTPTKSNYIDYSDINNKISNTVYPHINHKYTDDDDGVVDAKNIQLNNKVNEVSLNDKVNAAASLNNKVNELSLNDKVNELSLNDKVNEVSLNDKVNEVSLNSKVNEFSWNNVGDNLNNTNTGFNKAHTDSLSKSNGVNLNSHSQAATITQTLSSTAIEPYTLHQTTDNKNIPKENPMEPIRPAQNGYQNPIITPQKQPDVEAHDFQNKQRSYSQTSITPTTKFESPNSKITTTQQTKFIRPELNVQHTVPLIQTSAYHSSPKASTNPFHSSNIESAQINTPSMINTERSASIIPTITTIDHNHSALQPRTNPLIPFGDGSNKVFGYENFGNTCYCNSVLQCLYNMTNLRTNILQFPPRPISTNENMNSSHNNNSNNNNTQIFNRHRKNEMKGKTPRIFTEASFDKKNNANNNSNSNSTDSHKNQNDASTSNSKDHPSTASTQVLLTADTIITETATKRGHVIVGRADKKLFHDSHNNTPVILTAPPNAVIADNTNSTIISNTENNGNMQKENNGSAQYTGTTINSTISKTISTQTSSSIYNWDHDERLPSESRKKTALIRGPVLNIDHLLNESGKSNLYNGLKDIFECITENHYLTGIVSPVEFVEILKRDNILFNSRMHQDAHEFLNFLLNELSDYMIKCINEENLKKTIANNPNTDTHNTLTQSHTSNNQQEEDNNLPRMSDFISDLFRGTLINKTRCLTCDNVTSREEPFLDFPIEVKDDTETNIQTELKSYHQREMLNGSNKFYCDECGGLQEAERIVGLKQLPKTLSLHLKRFKYSEEQNCNIKLFNKVNYPLYLDVSSSFNPNINKRYELNGIVVHMGGGPQHGHYVAICKNDKFGWLLMDDETVETISEETVLRCKGDSKDLTTAYVLFYKECTPLNSSEEEEKQFKEETKKRIDDNIRHLVTVDKHMRERLKKKSVASVHSSSDDVDEKILMVNGNGGTALTSNNASNSPNPNVKQTKRKSRLLSFYKKSK